MIARMGVSAVIGFASSVVGAKYHLCNDLPLLGAAMLTMAIAYGVALLFVTNMGLYDDSNAGTFRG